jgi:uncharacterized delta-60 repeat protein
VVVGALVLLSAMPADAAVGQLDTSWSGDGITTISTPYDATVAPIPSGRVYVGSFREGDAGAMRIFRFDADGTLDERYGDGGLKKRVFTSNGSGLSFPRVLVPQGDPLGTKLSVVGEVYTADGRARVGLARLDRLGAYDTSFSSDGRTAFKIFTKEHDIVQPWRAVALNDGGLMVLVAAFDEIGGDFRYVGQAVFRTRADGTLNPAFSGDGILVLPDDWSDVAFTRGGTVFGGRASGENHQVRKLRSSGAPDTSFSGDGVTSVPCADNFGASLGVDTSGRPIVICHDLSGPDGGETLRFTLARFTTTGTLDSGWGGDGTTELTMANPSGARAWITHFESDGTPWVLASSVAGSTLELSRFASDGELDETFTGDGQASIAMASRVRFDSAGVAAGRLTLAMPRPGGQVNIVAVEES